MGWIGKKCTEYQTVYIDSISEKRQTQTKHISSDDETTKTTNPNGAHLRLTKTGTSYRLEQFRSVQRRSEVIGEKEDISLLQTNRTMLVT